MKTTFKNPNNYKVTEGKTTNQPHLTVPGMEVDLRRVIAKVNMGVPLPIANPQFNSRGVGIETANLNHYERMELLKVMRQEEADIKEKLGKNYIATINKNKS